MAFSPKELEIIKYGKANGKSREEVEGALARLRTGLGPEPVPVEAPKSGLLETLKDIPSDIVEGASGIVETIKKGVKTAQETVGKVSDLGPEGLEPGPAAAKVIGTGLGAGAGAVGEAFMTLAKLFVSPATEEGVAGAVAPIAKDILESEPVKALMGRYESLTPDQKAAVDGFLGTAEGLTTMFGIGPATRVAREGVESTYQAGKRFLTGLTEAIPEATGNIADDAFNYATKLKNQVKTSLSESAVNPQLKTSATRLFQNAEKAAKETVENPVAAYDGFLTQTRKAMADKKLDLPIEKIGEEIGDSFGDVVKQRQLVGKIMGEEIKTFGKNTVDLQSPVGKFQQELIDSGAAYDALEKTVKIGRDSKFTSFDAELLSKYGSEISSLGKTPTASQLDAFLSRLPREIKELKAAKGVDLKTNAERIISTNLNDIRTALETVATPKYLNARVSYSNLSKFIEEGSTYLGKITQSGDFAKDASIAKSAVQSVLNGGKKDWLIQLEALTGYPAIDRAVLALQAMKDAGEFKGLSLLETLSSGAAPTSKAGFTQKVLDFAVEQSKKAVVGTPEEQTRAFLESLSKQIPKGSSAVPLKTTTPSSSKIKFTDPKTGRYLPERQKLHDSIIQEELAKTSPQAKPKALFTTGHSAAGKSRFVEEVSSKKYPDYALVDADIMKSKIGGRDPFYHDEGSELALRYFYELAKGDRNLNFIGNIKNTPKYQSMLDVLKDRGYNISTDVVQTSKEVALQRAAERSLKGHVVPPEAVSEAYDTFQAGVELLKKYSTNVKKYDGTKSFKSQI